MTQTPPTVVTDFNLLDDDDVLWVARDELPTVAARQWVILRDGDENQCLGRVKRYDTRRIYIQAFLDTWQDAKPVEVSVEPNEALDEVLQRRVRDIADRELTFGVNTQR